jgi:hypothetical protein
MRVMLTVRSMSTNIQGAILRFDGVAKADSRLMSCFKVDFVVEIRDRIVMHVVPSDGSSCSEASQPPCVLVIAYALNMESCLLTSCR